MFDKDIFGNNYMGIINDLDDIFVMVGYLLMVNMFEIKGIVISSIYCVVYKDMFN